MKLERRFLAENFPKIHELVDLKGRSSLHYAAALREEEGGRTMYDFLLDAGAQKHIKDQVSHSERDALIYSLLAAIVLFLSNHLGWLFGRRLS